MEIASNDKFISGRLRAGPSCQLMKVTKLLFLWFILAGTGVAAPPLYRILLFDVGFGLCGSKSRAQCAVGGKAADRRRVKGVDSRSCCTPWSDVGDRRSGNEAQQFRGKTI